MAVDSDEMLAEFAGTHASPFELVFLWKESDIAVRLYVLFVNDQRLDHDMFFRKSPGRYSLPRPRPDGKFKVEWALEPQEKVGNIVAAIVNYQANTKVKLAESGEKAAASLWTDGGEFNAP